MSPVPTEALQTLSISTDNGIINIDPASRVRKIAGSNSSDIERLPATARARFERHNVDLSGGYPIRKQASDIPVYLDEALKIRSEPFEIVDRGTFADPEKKALFGAATKVIDLTKHIGTEIVGLQLAELSNKQLDELALLIAERTVVFFRDQDLSPQKQLEIGKYYGPVEVHPSVSYVPGLPGVSIIWPDYFVNKEGLKANFKKPVTTSNWHTDLTHEVNPAAITHLHNDTIPSVGGDTNWVSGYGAYDKLSPAFQKFLEGKKAVYRSFHGYVDRDDPLSGPKYIEREHSIIRTHPVTGWRSLFVNRAFTVRIVGLEPEESRIILEYLFNIFERSNEIQVRFRWQPTKPGLGTSALWDNRISQHSATWDYENGEPRHGTRVTALGEVPFLDPKSTGRREALGLSLD